jgi:hypothetical protein
LPKVDQSKMPICEVSTSDQPSGTTGLWEKNSKEPVSFDIIISDDIKDGFGLCVLMKLITNHAYTKGGF